MARRGDQGCLKKGGHASAIGQLRRGKVRIGVGEMREVGTHAAITAASTCAPSRARRCAVAAPMPVLAPVTIAALPSSRRMHLTSSRYLADGAMPQALLSRNSTTICGCPTMNA
jgi:hypothetical protein